MNVVLVSNVSSEREYLFVQSIKHTQKLNASQKYFDMLIQGLLADSDVKVTCLTSRFIASSTSNVKYLPEKKEQISEQLRYHYVSTPNWPIIRNLNNVIQGYVQGRKILKSLSQNDACVLICDPLAYDISFGAICAAIGKKVVKCAVITDLPYYMHQIKKEFNTAAIKNGVKTKFMNWLINRFDCYCFLTESMNIINPKNKPYVIIEGMIYQNADEIENNAVDNNVVLYAGGLYEQYGLMELLEAAKQIAHAGFELHLYGEGTCVDTINRITEEYPHIKYMGTKSLEEIVEIEKRAKLLINPRPSKEKFTEYSFPSKTIEYMATARPVLTTRLKGIPDEYFDYIYVIEDESADGIRQAIEDCLNTDNQELDKRGLQARRFVQMNKTNSAQAKQLLELLRNA